MKFSPFIWKQKALVAHLLLPSLFITFLTSARKCTPCTLAMAIRGCLTLVCWSMSVQRVIPKHMKLVTYSLVVQKHKKLVTYSLENTNSELNAQIGWPFGNEHVRNLKVLKALSILCRYGKKPLKDVSFFPKPLILGFKIANFW